MTNKTVTINANAKFKNLDELDNLIDNVKTKASELREAISQLNDFQLEVEIKI